MKMEGVYEKNAQESYYRTNSSCLTGLVAKNKFGMSKNIYQQARTVINLVPYCIGKQIKQIEAPETLC